MKVLVSILLFLFLVNCSGIDELRIISQDNGPWKTNCYLLYGTESKEAALIDAGWPLDSLLTVIETNDLRLKYILLTHCHQDHLSGVPELLKIFPDAELCFTKEEYDDMNSYSLWQDIYASESVEAWRMNSSIVKLMDFDYNQISEPDIFVEENSRFTLGDLTIRALKVPGHSRGSVSYYINKNLFSGDLIYFNTVGFLDYRFGSMDDIKKSVLKLYDTYSDDTIIYAGHGPVSTIGNEKTLNRTVPQDKEEL